MSSKTATATVDTSASSDKIEVSFATDDEEETSSEKSDNDTTSSSESGDEEKSQSDGDADDESEMPTFTLSLQPSAEANVVDDTLPDLSRSATSVTKQDAQQETVVTVMSSVSAAKTKTVSSVSELTSSNTKLDSRVSDVAKETAVKLSIPTKEDVGKESAEEAEESEKSEEETSDDEEENVEEQHLTPSSTVTTSTSPPVSTQTDTKENLTVSSSNLSVTETKILVEEEKEERVGKSETKTTSSAAKTVAKNDSGVIEVEGKRTSATKVEKSSTETIVVEQVANATTAADDNLPDLSRTTNVTAAKSDVMCTNDAEVASLSSVPKPGAQISKISKKDSAHEKAKLESAKADSMKTVVVEQVANVTIASDENSPDLSRTTNAQAGTSDIATDVEVALVSSVPKPDPQPLKKNKKDSAHDKTKLESAKADSTSLSVNRPITDADDMKQEDAVKETHLPPVESDKKTTKPIKLHKTSNELSAKKQSEAVETKSNNNRKTKDEAKEDRQEVTSTVEEEQTASVTVVIKQTKDRLQWEEEEKTSKAVTDGDSVPTVNPEKKKEAQKLDKSDKVGGATKVEAIKKSEEATKDVTNSISSGTKTKGVEVAVNGSVNEKETTRESVTSEAKLSSKKKSKHSTADDKEMQSKNVTDGPAVANEPQRDDRKSAGNVSESSVIVKSPDVFSSVAASEADTAKSSINATVSETEKNTPENRPNKDKFLPAANSGDVGTKLNDVEDKGKMSPGDDIEFRPRRNSIDEFIKRILAEAREEQKKILDSCAVSSGVDTASETSASASLKTTDGLSSSKANEPEQQQQPIMNGIDVGWTARTATKTREDFDIDEELADISRYYAKRTLVDSVATNDEEFASTFKADNSAKSKTVANGDERFPPAYNDEEVLHFVPQRRETTTVVVRESSRPVRVLMDQQTTVIRQLTEASRAIDELDNEVRQLRQATGGREALYASIGAAIRDEMRLYEVELTAVGERLGQQRLPGGGRFIREQFVAQCAEELLKKSAANNRPRLERAATVDDWTRVGRRSSGSLAAAAVEEDVGGSSWSGVKQWFSTPTDLMIQLRHSRSGSVVSDRGYSSIDTVDDSRGATPSSLLSRVTIVNGSTTATELDFGRNSRASSEVPRSSHIRYQPQSVSDDWLSTASSTYSVGRQYARYSRESAEDTSGEPDVRHHRISAGRPLGQSTDTSYRRYQPPSLDAPAPPHSRLYVRRGSLQRYSSYDSGSGSDAGRSFNSRFLSRVREKKALGDTTSRQTAADKPFRSRFLKSSSVTGSTSTSYSLSRSASAYDSDEN